MRLHDFAFRTLGAAAIGGLLAACSGNGAGFAPTAGASSNGVQAPSRSEGKVTDLGRATSATQVNLAVVMKYRNEDRLDALVDAQGTPGSGQYHHFLSQQAFVKKFGVTAGDYQTTVQKLRDAGFTVTHQFANRTIIDASAPAPTAEKFFSTEIHDVRRADGLVRYVNTKPETIPASIAGTVYTVVGLESVHALHPQYASIPGISHPHAVQGAMPNKKGKAPLFGPDGGYGPQVYRTSYSFPKNMTGKGQATGIVGDADYLDSDLLAYMNYFGEKQSTPTKRVGVDGGAPPGISGDSVETTLDIETIASIDPDTAVYLYTVPSEPDLRYFTDMYNQAVQDNKVGTVNTSYSECETALVTTFPKAAEKIFKQGAAEGITFHASSGDYGVYTYGCSSEVSIGSPTDTPHNVSIGGTTEQVNHNNGKETGEIGWNSDGYATGGGVSVVFKVPSYQKGVQNVMKSGRNIPDVSFDADPNTGVSLYYDGSFDGPEGGTSLASPIFGAGITAVNEMNGTRAGYLNPTMYKQWQNVGYGTGKTTYFRDITQGSIPPYQAMTGYDQMTGIGAMVFDTFGKLLK